jgi:glycosyltransferase involved in cell wall biosynthesis
MRLVVVSHPAVTPVNQAFFARLASLTGWDLDLILPERWHSEYGHRRAERWPQYEGGMHPRRVLLSGNIPLHVYAARLSPLLRQLAPDAIYVHHEPYALATAQVLQAARRFRGAFGFYSAQNIEKRYPWPIPAFEKAVYRRADFAFPVTQAVLDVLRAKGYAGRASVLPLPIDTEALRPHARSVGRPFTVGFVGRLAPEKGVDLLIDALRETEDVNAVIVGDGSSKHDLHDRAAAAGVASRVHWRGYVAHDRISDAYADFDVLVVPSRPIQGWTEQFGRVVVEALASGVPVIAANSGELPRLLEETGGGWLFQHDDAASLAGRIKDAADHAERAGRGEAGRRVVLARFGLDAVAVRFAAEVEAASRTAAGAGDGRLAASMGSR